MQNKHQHARKPNPRTRDTTTENEHRSFQTDMRFTALQLGSSSSEHRQGYILIPCRQERMGLVSLPMLKMQKVTQRSSDMTTDLLNLLVKSLKKIGCHEVLILEASQELPQAPGLLAPEPT